MNLLTYRAKARVGAYTLAFVLAGCSAGASLAIEPAAPDRLLEFDETIGMEIRRRLANSAGRISKREKAERAGLASFYENRGNMPVFVSRKGLTSLAIATAAEIRNSGRWALRAEDFALPRLAAAKSDGPDLSRAVLAAAELKLGLAVLKYARFASGGRTNPGAISKSFDRQPQLPMPEDVMEEIASAPEPENVLRGFHPAHPQFRRLLGEYLAMARGEKKAASKLPKLPAGPSLKKGVKHAGVTILRQRLGTTPPSGVDPQMFDAQLDNAVRAYQQKAGLSVDGVVGPGTRASLNGGEVQGTPEMLLANLEQWRWMPKDLGDMYIWVNIPEFKVRVMKKGRIIHTERVVVGKPANQTPIFSEKLKWVEFHPSWYVPASIKMNEIAPGYRRRGNSFLQKQNLKVSCPDSAYVRSKPKVGLFGFAQPQPRPRLDFRNCSVVQPPGPTNVLGVVKFKLPNRHNVYLHDTSSKSLFERRVRAFSHGCIRVRNPLKLAEIVLGHDQGISGSRIRSIANGPRRTLQTYLKTEMPVHITYFTAVADETGKLGYYKDLYRHEKRIALGMAGKYDQIIPIPQPARPGPAPPASVPSATPKVNKDWFKAIFDGF